MEFTTTTKNVDIIYAPWVSGASGSLGTVFAGFSAVSQRLELILADLEEMQ